MSKKDHSSSKYLNSVKEAQEESKKKKSNPKIDVDRTYIEPQQFQSKKPKKMIRFSSYQD